MNQINRDNLSYLGLEFQIRLLAQILTDFCSTTSKQYQNISTRIVLIHLLIQTGPKVGQHLGLFVFGYPIHGQGD